MRSIGLVFLCLGASTTSARADFVVREPSATSPTSPSSGLAERADPGDDSARARPRPEPPAPRFRMAYGFGDHVPLGFACRQIVPRPVRVTYGPGATPDQLVSWKGGDTWNHVLRDAVRPLGLRLLMTQTAVEIRR